MDRPIVKTEGSRLERYPAWATRSRTAATMGRDEAGHPQDLVDDRDQRIGVDRFEKTSRCSRHRFSLFLETRPLGVGDHDGRQIRVAINGSHLLDDRDRQGRVIAYIDDQQILLTHGERLDRGVTGACTNATVPLAVENAGQCQQRDRAGVQHDDGAPIANRSRFRRVTVIDLVHGELTQ